MICVKIILFNLSTQMCKKKIVFFMCFNRIVVISARKKNKSKIYIIKNSMCWNIKIMILAHKNYSFSKSQKKNKFFTGLSILCVLIIAFFSNFFLCVETFFLCVEIIDPEFSALIDFFIIKHATVKSCLKDHDSKYNEHILWIPKG